MMLTQDEVLHKPFDLETHKAVFTNYFEAVITGDGTIVYAVPSHQDTLARIYHMRTGRNANDAVPRERWCDMLDWLMEETGCVCAYTAGTIGKVQTEMQRETIGMLRREGLIND